MGIELARAVLRIRADASGLKSDLKTARANASIEITKLQKQLAVKTGGQFAKDRIKVAELEAAGASRKQIAEAQAIQQRSRGIDQRRAAEKQAARERLVAIRREAALNRNKFKTEISLLQNKKKVAIQAQKEETKAVTQAAKKRADLAKRTAKLALSAIKRQVSAEKVAERDRLRAIKQRQAAERTAERKKQQAIKQRQAAERAAERQRLQGIRRRERAERAAGRQRMAAFKQQTRALGLFASAALGATALFGAGIIRGSIAAAGSLEQLTVSLETILGGAEIAQRKIKELQDFAARTPFTIPGVENAARGLVAVGFNAEELLPTLKSLGDISAGLGRGEEGLRRLVLNLGQVRAQGKLTGRELRDFAILGVPILEELANAMGRNKKEIIKMTQSSQISSKVVEEAFRRMSEAGGRFADLMIKQNKTMVGLFSNLKDEIIISSRVLGKDFLPVVKNSTKSLIALARSMRIVIQDSDGMIGAMVAGASAAASLGAAVAGAAVAMNILGISMKTALIGTGIGAVLVLLGVGIGALINVINKSAESLKKVTILSNKLKLIWIQLKKTALTTFTIIGEILKETFGVGFKEIVEIVKNTVFKILEKIADLALNFAEWMQAIIMNWKGLWEELPKIAKAGGSFLFDIIVNTLKFMGRVWLTELSLAGDIIKNWFTKVMPQLIGLGLTKFVDLVADFGKKLSDFWVKMWTELPDPKKILTALATGGIGAGIAVGKSLQKAAEETAESFRKGFVLGQAPTISDLLTPSERSLKLLDQVKKSMNTIFEPSERTKRLLSEIDVFKDIVEAKRKIEKERALPPVEAPKPKEEGENRKRGKEFGEAAAKGLKGGRFGFLEFGQKIQGILVKQEKDGTKKTNSLLENVVKNQVVQIQQQKPGLGP